ncbi:peptidylprolyl isomerase [Mangrovimonas sp. ST2L15]|uniref:peptidylprolyl isomerase n=1 Tax=Mangrovimonas sp. ST2L15 TaxID=1645916 RepID=UPI0006B424ED|nr:peptidylprolyl isomerase [Mangrovimonas sp. ST2L15]
MKFLNHSFRILMLALLASFTSCSQKYPDLRDGLYAEFVTNKGTMVAKLFYKEVPVTVANFVALAEGTHPNVTDSLKNKKYYNGTTFHRVIDKFMIQGGDPTATGMGDPGYKFIDEFYPDLKHDKPGILSMANSGPNTNGSQFFITEVPTGHLDNKHAVFGELVIGLEVLDSISNVKVTPGSNKPVEDVIISQLNIIRKGSEAEAFDAAKVYTEELPKVEERQQQIEEEKKQKLKEDAAVSAEKFLEKFATEDSRVIKSPTGLVMIFTKETDGIKPDPSQRVLIDCAGYFENGKLFWTTWKEVAQENNMYQEVADNKGAYKPFSMPYNETASLVAGFRESMLQMKIGEEVKAFIPSYLGYGDRQYGPIPPNSNLIFDIKLTAIDE